MGDYQIAQTLDYNKVKAKKGLVSGLFAGKKIKKANAQIKAACTETNQGVTENKTEKGTYINGENKEDEAGYEIVEGEQTQSEGHTDEQVCVSNSNQGVTTTAETQVIGDMYAANTQRFAEMTETTTADTEAILMEMQDAFNQMNEAGVIIAANGTEVEALTAELAALAEEEAGGGFSTGMAAAGGQNSAYSLNVPVGTNNTTSTTSADGKKQGGLISSGNTGKTNNIYSGAANNAASTASGSSTSSRTQEIYARLNEIETENYAMAQLVTTCSETAIRTQTEYAEAIGTTTETTNEELTVAEEDKSGLEKTAEVFNKITEVGQYTKLAGVATSAVGLGMEVAGTTITVIGSGVKVAGTTMGGIGAGLKALGAALLPGVFTAPAGSAVGAAGVTVDGAAATLTATGEAVTVTGSGLSKAGVVTNQVGQGIQIAGDAGMAVGSAGTMVTGIASGNLMAAVGGAMSFLGSAAGCLNNTAQFAQSIGAAKDGFLGSIAQVSQKVNGALDKAVGATGGAVSGAGAKALQTAGQTMTGMSSGNSFFGALAGSMSLMSTTGTQTNTTTPTQNNTTSSLTDATKNKAKSLGLTDAEIQNKSETQVLAMIKAKEDEAAKAGKKDA